MRSERVPDLGKTSVRTSSSCRRTIRPQPALLELGATMASFENTVTIRRPVEDAFAFLADFENVPQWNYAIVETPV
jgi:uncharacterized membrane protein